MRLYCKNKNVLLADLYAEAGAFDLANGLKITYSPLDRYENNIKITNELFELKIRIIQNAGNLKINYCILTKIQDFVTLDKLDAIRNFVKAVHILLENNNYFELIDN